MKQANIFLESEGDAWYARNKDKLGQRDLVSRLIEANKIVPTNVLEIGCANGWRLAKLRERYQCRVYGIEPSALACGDAELLNVPVEQTTAIDLPPVMHAFDLIIYGFCLYMTDPQDWFAIVCDADRVLANGGHIVIHDFESSSPWARPYGHREGLLSYHVDFAKMWLANPLYHLVSRNIGDEDDMGVVTIIKKSPATSIKVHA